ncbi:hypothetical protein PIB30_061498 [Stylosanthes scabra]|uniref:CCHC-type domain-containing protein n=1 Tax=Stylosanthes scabra TaxID=79078 RepID=A0ABU6RLG5_9FABA|nr:hypothetical protein [Stylosanthes scabra]
MINNGFIQSAYHNAMYPIPGEPLWEKSQFNRPLATLDKRKPGCLKKKRRKDADEGPSGSKKPKDQTKLKRKYREFTCTYCGTKGNTKRSCTHKKNDDAACVEVAAVKAAKNKENTANLQSDGVASEHAAHATTGVDLANEDPIAEIDISQPNYSQQIIVEEQVINPLNMFVI